jgi:hypothetical protein
LADACINSIGEKETKIKVAAGVKQRKGVREWESKKKYRDIKKEGDSSKSRLRCCRRSQKPSFMIMIFQEYHYRWQKYTFY